MDQRSFKAAFGGYLEGLVSQTKASSAASAGHNWSPGMLPYDSGFMANSAFRLEETPTGWKISIDTGLAPYAAYIDSSGHYTQGYWDELMASIIRKISDDWGGSLSSGGKRDD